MAGKHILWIDDEIESLEPYVQMLESHGYKVAKINSGREGLDYFNSHDVDLVLLDEQMPGMGGLDVLREIKRLKPEAHVIMATRTTAMETYESAKGLKSARYLTKPLKPFDIITAVRDELEAKEIEHKHDLESFAKEYRLLNLDISSCRTFADWCNVYKRLVDWEIKFDGQPLQDNLKDLKRDANIEFCRFVTKNYQSWIQACAKSQTDETVPLLSHAIMSKVVLPLMSDKVALVVIDNFRLDQWHVLRPLLSEEFRIEENYCSSILPTATQFARNAIFSGMLPDSIKKQHPELWIDQSNKEANEQEESLNANERQLLDKYFVDRRINNKYKYSYYRVGSNQSGAEYIKKFDGYKKNNLNAIVFSFIDVLSHSATDNHTVKETIPDDAAYRRLTRSWFYNAGSLSDVLKTLSNNGYTIVLTTDHGTIRVTNDVEISGSKSINTNERFKFGSNIKYDEKRTFVIDNPTACGLPGKPKCDRYIFALNSDLFVYPNNKNEYKNRFAGSLQHGGVSMEEMILPLVILRKK